MRVDLSHISVGTITDQGRVREENQDAVGFFKTEDGEWMFLLVCDGMGGHAGGRMASTLAVEAIKCGLMEELSKSQSPTEAIVEAIRRTNTEVYQYSEQNPELRGMGTTCALIALHSEGKCWLAHVGDSRIFHILPGVIEQKTRDHTTVQRLVDGGLIEAKDAENHPDAGLLSRCIGVKQQVEPDVQGPIELQEGDRFLACSDGLTNEVDPKEIGAMLLAFETTNALERLVMLANERGGKDNISIVACYIPGQHEPTGKFNPKAMQSLVPPVLTTVQKLLSTPEPPHPPVSEVTVHPLEPPLVLAHENDACPNWKRLWTKRQLVTLLVVFWVGFVCGGVVVKKFFPNVQKCSLCTFLPQQPTQKLGEKKEVLPEPKKPPQVELHNSGMEPEKPPKEPQSEPPPNSEDPGSSSMNGSKSDPMKPSPSNQPGNTTTPTKPPNSRTNNNKPSHSRTNKAQ